nr:succinate dehydrogenase, hydrophobic membrane anchor protein [uncultured Rhodopila sp.]
MSDTKGLKIETMRSFLGRARGLGTAHTGFHFWWAQRLTSLALVPLTVWFVFAMARLAGAPYAEVRAWIGDPIHATLMLAVIATTFPHLHLGVQTVAEDYIHTGPIRMGVILTVKAASGLLALAATIAVLKLAVAG